MVGLPSVSSAASIPASGVRRSWDTAARIEVRIASASRSRCASAARTARRLRSSTAAVCRANASSSRRSDARSGWPVRASVRFGPASTTTSASVGLVGASTPEISTARTGPWGSSCSNSVAPFIVNVSRA